MTYLINQYNQGKTFISSITMPFFVLKSKSKKKPKVYWVLEEPEPNTEDTLRLKFYDEKNTLLCEEAIPGRIKGVINDEIMTRITQIKNQIIRKFTS